jgi:hypothetical protein
LFAFAALVALAAGAGLAFLWPLAGRMVGIWLFLAACVASWSQATPSLFLARLDPVQAVLGSVGWALFALGWARQEKSGPAPDAVPPGHADLPRHTVPRRLRIMVAMVSLAGALPLILAWWVRGLERALVAHAVAIAAAIALVTSAAELGEAGTRGKHEAAAPRARLSAAAPGLVLLCILAALGAGYSLLR